VQRTLTAPATMVAIGDMARLTGLTPRAIRHYEEHRLIRPARDRRGVRRFDSAMVGRLVFVGHARRAGLSIAQVRELLALGDRMGEAGRAGKALQFLNDRLASLDSQRAAVEQSIEALGLGLPSRRLRLLTP
jgi:DNA-binding transcriptional MerR regulator